MVDFGRRKCRAGRLGNSICIPFVAKKASECDRSESEFGATFSAMELYITVSESMTLQFKYHSTVNGSFPTSKFDKSAAFSCVPRLDFNFTRYLLSYIFHCQWPGVFKAI
jgi:hypothetical protein